ncbi:hypothetical protein EDB84DRAFT_1676120 [Lactarius hengduanensis]|nr:hypothetical protein EDB84DRAFT_1676120 [Lactarius hengduanensis]
MFSMVLEAASEFDVQDTSPELRQDFCALWNQIVLKAQIVDNSTITLYILRPIHNAYIVLHRDTNSASTRFSASTRDGDDILSDPSSYPLCTVAGHIHDSASTPFDRTVLHDNATLPPSPLAIPDSPFSFVPGPHHVDETLTDVPPLNNDIYVPGAFHPAHQTAAENFHIPSTSRDPVTARVLPGGVETSTTMTPLSAPEPSAPLPPDSTSSAPPPGAVAVQHIEDRRTLNVLDISSLPSPTPALDNILPIESHSSLRVPAAPGPSCLRPSSAPDLGAAAERGGSAEVTSHMEMDAVDPPSAIRENNLATPDHPPQSPSLPSVTDLTITGLSQRSLGAVIGIQKAREGGASYHQMEETPCKAGPRTYDQVGVGSRGRQNIREKAEKADATRSLNEVYPCELRRAQ